VHFGELKKIALKYGLEIEEQANFHRFYRESIQNDEFKQLARRMRVFPDNGKLSNDEWEVAGLYMAFAFRKKEDPNWVNQLYQSEEPRSIQNNEIIIG